MARYQVVEACYVPVGPGLRFKQAGAVVELDDDDAQSLGGYVQPATELPDSEFKIVELNGKSPSPHKGHADKPEIAIRSGITSGPPPEEKSPDG